MDYMTCTVLEECLKDTDDPSNMMQLWFFFLICLFWVWIFSPFLEHFSLKDLNKITYTVRISGIVS